MEKFEKVLLSTAEHMISSELNSYSLPEKYFKECLKNYSKLGLKPLEAKDLNTLIENPKAFIIQQITHGESLNIGGLKMNPEKLFEIIEKPPGTEEFIESLLKDKQDKWIREGSHFRVDCFVVSNGTEIEICPKLKTSITEKHSIFLECENQKKALEILDILAENMNKLFELKTSNEFHHDNFFSVGLTKKEGKYEKNFRCLTHFK
jgi:hypothetical protein